MIVILVISVVVLAIIMIIIIIVTIIVLFKIKTQNERKKTKKDVYVHLISTGFGSYVPPVQHVTHKHICSFSIPFCVLILNKTIS